jgi:hypothetical protein
MPTYWIWGDSSWRGLRRARLPITVGFLSLATGVIVPALILPLGIAAFAVGLPLAITTFLFNWPKIIVPPALRSEEGVLDTGRVARNRN